MSSALLDKSPFYSYWTLDQRIPVYHCPCFWLISWPKNRVKKLQPSKGVEGYSRCRVVARDVEYFTTYQEIHNLSIVVVCVVHDSRKVLSVFSPHPPSSTLTDTARQCSLTCFLSCFARTHARKLLQFVWDETARNDNYYKCGFFPFPSFLIHVVFSVTVYFCSIWRDIYNIYIYLFPYLFRNVPACHQLVHTHTHVQVTTRIKGQMSEMIGCPRRLCGGVGVSKTFVYPCPSFGRRKTVPASDAPSCHRRKEIRIYNLYIARKRKKSWLI